MLLLQIRITTLGGTGVTRKNTVPWYNTVESNLEPNKDLASLKLRNEYASLKRQKKKKKLVISTILIHLN